MSTAQIAVALLAAVILILWYRRYSERQARRTWAAYHRWVRNPRELL